MRINNSAMELELGWLCQAQEKALAGSALAVHPRSDHPGKVNMKRA